MRVPATASLTHRVALYKRLTTITYNYKFSTVRTYIPYIWPQLAIVGTKQNLSQWMGRRTFRFWSVPSCASSPPRFHSVPGWVSPSSSVVPSHLLRSQRSPSPSGWLRDFLDQSEDCKSLKRHKDHFSSQCYKSIVCHLMVHISRTQGSILES